MFGKIMSLKEHAKGKDLLLGKAGFLEEQLLKESVVVADDSMKVLKEFETLEEDTSSDDSNPPPIRCSPGTPFKRGGKSY